MTHYQACVDCRINKAIKYKQFSHLSYVDDPQHLATIRAMAVAVDKALCYVTPFPCISG